LNNLRLVHLVIFNWLDRIFGHEAGDMRLVVNMITGFASRARYGRK
jgi:hypothetical protein